MWGACANLARWGCKLSQKLFVGKEYVLKHIRLKHAAIMEAQREEVCALAIVRSLNSSHTASTHHAFP